MRKAVFCCLPHNADQIIMKIYKASDFILQGKQTESLLRSIPQNDFPHAVLLCGDTGIGKRSLAYACAASLLCDEERLRPCFSCRSCKLLENDENPDLIRVRSGIPLSPDTKAGRQTIPVDDIREVIRLSGEYALLGRNRVIVIENAETMTIQAQNCLLKTLEDPPEHVYFILTVSQPSLLIQTVLSRCRTIYMHGWPDDYIRTLLSDRTGDPKRIDACISAANGSIGKAYELSNDEDYWALYDEAVLNVFECKERSSILPYVNSWQSRKEDLDRFFDCVGSIISDIYRIRFGVKNISAQLPPSWKANLNRYDISTFTELNDAVKDARIMKSSSVNVSFILETLIMKIMEVRQACR